MSDEQSTPALTQRKPIDVGEFGEFVFGAPGPDVTDVRVEEINGEWVRVYDVHFNFEFWTKREKVLRYTIKPEMKQARAEAALKEKQDSGKYAMRGLTTPEPTAQKP